MPALTRMLARRADQPRTATSAIAMRRATHPQVRAWAGTRQASQTSPPLRRPNCRSAYTQARSWYAHFRGPMTLIDTPYSPDIEAPSAGNKVRAQGSVPVAAGAQRHDRFPGLHVGREAVPRQAVGSPKAVSPRSLLRGLRSATALQTPLPLSCRLVPHRLQFRHPIGILVVPRAEFRRDATAERRATGCLPAVAPRFAAECPPPPAGVVCGQWLSDGLIWVSSR